MEELRSRTSLKEKIERFEHINGIFMAKYLDLVWYARSNPERLIENEEYEIVSKVLGSIKKMEEKYPSETNDLASDESSWHHGFNSGILAYSRFLDSYIEDSLWEVSEDNEEIAENEKVIIINGKRYIEFDGKSDAEENFPELDT